MFVKQLEIEQTQVQKNGFKFNVYFPLLDSLISEFDHRFSPYHCAVFTGIQALTPKSETFADLDHVKDFAELYGGDLTDLAHELHQSKRLLDRMPSDNKP